MLCSAGPEALGNLGSAMEHTEDKNQGFEFNLGEEAGVLHS